jgi:hypothetical protein
MTPELDLFMIRFCNREQVKRSMVMRQALLDFLMHHAPELCPAGSLETIIEERFELRGNGTVRGVPNGPSKASLEESSVMKLFQAQASKVRSR